MGIHGLCRFLADKAPRAVQSRSAASFVSRTVAVDASLSLYQFMVAIRDSDGWGQLTNSQGETTSHISGMLNRVVKILELGMHPVYVFDGKAPTLKSGELAKRRDRKETAQTELEDAKERGDAEEIKKFAGRTVTVTKKHNEDVKKLLKLMGVPLVEAPGEAEAQCARLCIDGRAYATVTEDADALCFGSPFVIRHLTFTDPKNKDGNIQFLDLQMALEELGFTMSQFIDFCILCGCDYCDTIRGIGPGKAYKLIQENKSLESVIENLDPTKHPIPENFPYEEARRFFIDPDVLGASAIPEFSWTDPDVEGLRRFLVEDNQFNPDRVENAINKLKKIRQRGNQTRLDSFFTVTKTLKRPSVADIKTTTVNKKRKKAS